jgi:hypothetical protein
MAGRESAATGTGPFGLRCWRLPAGMAAVVTDRLRSFANLFDAVMHGGYAVAA